MASVFSGKLKLYFVAFSESSLGTFVEVSSPGAARLGTPEYLECLSGWPITESDSRSTRARLCRLAGR
jgi:hypothetical protein